MHCWILLPTDATTQCQPCGTSLGSPGGPAATTTCTPAADFIFDTPGNFSVAVPAGVTRVSAVCVGGGAGANGLTDGDGSGGGGESHS